MAFKSMLLLEVEGEADSGKTPAIFCVSYTKKPPKTLSLALGTTQLDFLLELSLFLNKSESSQLELGLLWCTNCIIPGAR